MIQTKNELKEIIAKDRTRYEIRKPRFLGWLFGDETYSIVSYLKTLRYLEYYSQHRCSISGFVMHCFYFFKHRRQRVKTGVYINVNTCGGGIYIPHCAGGVYVNCVRAGENLTISSGCVLGVKGSEPGPILGDNVEVAIGSKIIGNVKIGNNVIVAPNSVVITDIPDNAIVSGVPAKIIKIR